MVLNKEEQWAWNGRVYQRIPESAFALYEQMMEE